MPNDGFNDELIEAYWSRLKDIDVNRDNRIKEEFLRWPKGTELSTIWVWFDKYHSQGTDWLIDNV